MKLRTGRGLVDDSFDRESDGALGNDGVAEYLAKGLTPKSGGQAPREPRLSGWRKYVALAAIGALAVGVVAIPLTLARPGAHVASEASPSGRTSASSNSFAGPTYVVDTPTEQASASPVSAATSQSKGGAPAQGGGTGWEGASVTFSPTMEVDQQGWVSIDSPPFETYCTYSVSGGGVTFFTEPDFTIIPSTVDTEWFSVPANLTGTADVEVTCRPAYSSTPAPAHWHGEVTVTPIPSWSLNLQIDYSQADDQWTMHFNTSRVATCVLTMTFPKYLFGNSPNTITQTFDLGPVNTTLFSASVAGLKSPDVVTYEFDCVERVTGASHTLSGSFQIVPTGWEPSPTDPPSAPPTDAPTPAPTPAASEEVAPSS